VPGDPCKRFWHSPHGGFGCTDAIWEFIRLLGIQNIRNKYPDYEVPLFKLLFLYLSKSIAVCHIEKLLQGMDFYRNRANLVLKNRNVFMCIFLESEFVANMKIHYVSDTFLGFKLCSDLGVCHIGSERLKDSRKMVSIV